MNRSIALVVAPDPITHRHLSDGLFSSNLPSEGEDIGLWDLLRLECNKLGISLHTKDLMESPDLIVSLSDPLFGSQQPWFLYITEPPVVRPDIYRQLNELEMAAARIFTHSPEIASRGGPYRVFSLPIYIPLEETPNKRDEFLVLINANKRPLGLRRPWQVRGELYTARLRTAARLAKKGLIDVYGPGWDRTLNVYAWAPWTRQVRKQWKGTTESKHSTLARYDFCLAFENCIAAGYITEKVFDAMAAGSIPIYLGDPQIQDVLPEETFIDYRNFRSVRRLEGHLLAMSNKEKAERRRAMAEYLRSDSFRNRFSVQAWVGQLLREAEPFLKSG